MECCNEEICEVEYFNDLYPSIGLEHFIINTWILEMRLLLLLIRRGAAYLITLIIMEFVKISLVRRFENLIISLSTDDL